MSKYKLYIIILSMCITATAQNGHAKRTQNSISLYTGFFPVMGGNLHSSAQADLLGINNGIDGINRFSTSVDNERVDKLTGICVGTEFTVLIFDLLVLKAGINYSKSMFGGSGTSTDPGGNSLKVTYEMWTMDVPFQAGISYPFNGKTRISFCGGIALAYGSYSNSFKSAAVNSSASFSGWAIPLCASVGGEYMLSNELALNTTISYYKGRTGTIKNKSDYASIDFTGFRWHIGATYYFIDVTSKRL